MSESDTVHERPPARPGHDLRESIFPTFNVNVPMPADTAVPGSYSKPLEPSAAGNAAPTPAKAAE